MNKRPFQFDISVSADKKRRAKNRSSSGSVETSEKRCEYNGCKNKGTFRAPKSSENVDDFQWFCLNHVREYNQNWNFFKNHSTSEMETQIKADSLWGRKTKPIKPKSNNTSHPEGRAWARLGFDDAYSVLGEMGSHREKASSNTFEMKLSGNDRKAAEILGIREEKNKSEIRKIYKALVKDLHPDRNSGRRDDEEELSKVVWAWEQIKVSRSFKD